MKFVKFIIFYKQHISIKILIVLNRFIIVASCFQFLHLKTKFLSWSLFFKVLDQQINAMMFSYIKTYNSVYVKSKAILIFRFYIKIIIYVCDIWFLYWIKRNKKTYYKKTAKKEQLVGFRP